MPLAYTQKGTQPAHAHTHTHTTTLPLPPLPGDPQPERGNSPVTSSAYHSKSLKFILISLKHKYATQTWKGQSEECGDPVQLTPESASPPAPRPQSLTPTPIQNHTGVAGQGVQDSPMAMPPNGHGRRCLLGHFLCSRWDCTEAQPWMETG